MGITLYGNAELNYNWNLEVFVTNQKGRGSKALVHSHENGNKKLSHIKGGNGSSKYSRF